MYLKILLVWAFVMMADFLLDFRFEYFWPTWLLLRSIYDSIRYQGAAFSVFFVCVTVTSDIICFVFIPVQWLFFLASTYVWVQYVWHTDRGICLPTVSLWLLYIYVEVSIRLKELKSIPFTLDLCRPFAAHCIGYPVVTLGFGVKSYVSYRLRLRRQREVAKCNEFYSHVLQDSLPAERRSDIEVQKHEYLPNSEDLISNGAVCSGSGGGVNSSSIAVAVCHNNNTSKTPSSVNSNNLSSSASSSSYHHRHSSASSSARLTKSYNIGSSSIPKNYSRSKSNNNSVMGGWSNVGDDTSSAILPENGHTSMYDDDEDVSRQDSSSSVLFTIFSWFNIFTWRLFGFNASAPTSGGGGGAVDGTGLLLWSGNDYCRDSDEESGESKDSADSAANMGGVGGGHNSSSAASLLDYRSNNATSSTKKTFQQNAPLKYRNVGGGASKVRNRNKNNVYSSSIRTSVDQYGGDQLTPNDPVVVNQQHLVNKDLNSVQQAAVADQKEKVQDKDLCLSLELDMEKIKTELRSSRAREQELRRQLNELTTSDKSSKNELQQCRQQNEQLQTKLQNLVRARQQDKQTIATLEKKVCEEQKLKLALEQQLQAEKKLQKKSEETKLVSTVNLCKLDCTEVCKQRRREMESQVQQLRRDLQQREEQMSQMENEIMILRQYKDKNQTSALMSALSALQEKNRHLETSLSAETRIKLDLFSALGDTKRQLEIAQNELVKREKECEAVRRHFNEMLSGGNSNVLSNCNSNAMSHPSAPSSPLPIDNSKVEALAAALYTAAPSYNNSMSGIVDGLIFEDSLMPTDYTNLPPYVSTSSGNSILMAPPGGESPMRYTPPRSC